MRLESLWSAGGTYKKTEIMSLHNKGGGPEKLKEVTENKCEGESLSKGERMGEGGVRGVGGDKGGGGGTGGGAEGGRC